MTAAAVRGEEELGYRSSFDFVRYVPFSIGTSTRFPHSVHEPS
jgi:hypothetical protein